jgi:hypothetical protein
MIYILLIILYFITPSLFYIYTQINCKKYNRSITWCDNAAKINKKHYVAIPLSLIGIISFILFLTSIYAFNLNNTFIWILFAINLLSYKVWIITIYKSFGNMHLLVGVIYI